MEKQISYSLFEIKSLSEEKREITGIATTPEPDRENDIIVTEGLEFKNPVPLLWQHNSGMPVGRAEFGRASSAGLPFKAWLPKIKEDGLLKDWVNLAWQSVREELVRWVSIGFRPKEYSRLDTGGVKFSACEILELSLVSIPANASATIQTIKAFDKRRGGIPLIATNKQCEKSKIVSVGGIPLVSKKQGEEK